MSIGDNIKRFAADTAKIAAQKSGDVFESVKNKYNEYDITTEISALYKKLGTAVYSGYKNGDGFSYSLVCPSCSKACEPNTAYCPHCGAKLS